MVYVTQEQPGKNISSAMKYGTLKVLVEDPTRQIGFAAGAVVQKLMVQLSNFCDDDYLLLIGDPTLIAITAMVAGLVNNGRIKLLKWDNMEHCYIPTSVNAYQEREKDDGKFTFGTN